MLVDFHLHSHNSPDGAGTIEEILESAAEKGLSQIAVTDHYEAVQNECFACETDIPAYVGEAERCMDNPWGVALRLGIEIGQPQFDIESVREIIKNNSFDFIIGSIHNLSGDRDLFFFDYNTIDHVAVFEEYLDEEMNMARVGDFDVAAHLTYPLRYMWSQAQKRIDIEKYEDRWRELFSELISKGRGIEVNTSGLRQEIEEFLPPIYLVRLYRECGGEIITVGSDSHRPQDVGRDVDKGLEMIKAAGFEYFTVFKDRKPEFIRL